MVQVVPVRALLILCLSVVPAFAEVASCYGPESGTKTASGEKFDWHANTAACCGPGYTNLPFGTWVRVTYRGKSVTVRITDRGPFIRGRYIDLSLGACRRIGLDVPGADKVEVQVTGTPYGPIHHSWGAF
jgi:rare lipoprotein A